MLSLMIQKLLHKKWMVLCILIGNVLLISIAVSHPMYRNASFQRMLTDEFNRYWEEKEEWPAGFRVTESVLKNVSACNFTEIDMSINQIIKEIEIPVKEYVAWYEMKALNGEAGFEKDGVVSKNILLSAVTGLEEHVEILYGRLPEPQITEDGYIEVMVTEEALVKQDLLLNEEFKLDALENKNKEKVKIRITGVFRPKDTTECYWVIPEFDLNSQIFVNMSLFQENFVDRKRQSAIMSMTANWYVMWDYEQISATHVADSFKTYQVLIDRENLGQKTTANAFHSVVTDYSAKAKRVEATLAILQIPILLLLCAFLYMISSQMLQMEQNEISLMKSRGANKRQIISLYLLQSGFLSLTALAIGLPAGSIICRILGSSTGFMEFSARRTLNISFTQDVFIYAGAAILAAVAMTTLPVMKYSGISIVKLKQSKARRKKSLWKKLYLDAVCIAISLYGYYSFRKNEQNLMENILRGEAMDPLLYISFSLFILGCGLLICRLQPVIMKLIFRISGNRLKPAAYASLLETIRTGYKQEFIILFMILTVAIGISNTTMSRTIIANTTSNLKYLTGADLNVQEEWESNIQAYVMGWAAELEYYEPEYEKFQRIPEVETATKVFRCKTMNTGHKEKVPVNLMGIQVKGFAQVTTLYEGLLPYSYEEYLNVLAGDRGGLLVSENFMTVLGYKLGDTVRLRDNEKNEISGRIRGFFEYWPGYVPRAYEVKEDGSLGVTENYMAVGNFSFIQSITDIRPYEVWMKVSDEGQGFYQWSGENPNIKFQNTRDMNTLLAEKKEDTLIQGTNGILSMSFIIVLVLCGVGYLIYWIMSIRSRELLFGVLRAMGMKKKEIIWMLIVEQICSGLFAIAAGGGIGIVSSYIFVPMIQKAYAAADQVLPLSMNIDIGGIVQLFAVIIIMLCICLIVLGRIVSKMNISNALKLGED